MKPHEIYNLIMRETYTTSGLGVDWTTVIEPTGQKVYLLFQGSTTADDWLHNFDFLPRPCRPYKDMKYPWFCHAGIAKMYKSARDDIKTAIAEIMKEHPIYDICVAGHSQGGGIAQLCAEDLAYDGYATVSCVTFGSPRVFYGRNARYHICSQVILADQYENGSDIVPTVPPFAFSIGHARYGHTVHVGEPFSLLKVKDTAKYHMGYGDAELYE